MALPAAWKQLDADLDVLALHFKDFAASKSSLNLPSHFSLLDECLLEGLLSRVWQSWCGFCRTCVVESCMGTVNASGVTVMALPDAISEAHVSGAAVVAKKKSARPPYWGNTNALLRSEPTWGDTDVLADLLVRLQPANSATMLAAFSSAHSRAKALQTIRNGAAHNHHQTLADIQLLWSAYIAFPINHPTHAMFWIEPTSSDFLITHIIDVLRDAGLLAIS
jgi:hypothetical protein